MPVPVIPVEAGLPIIKELISSVTSYLTTREQEKTKRQEIAAKLEGYLMTINKEFDQYAVILEHHHEDAMKAFSTVETLINNPQISENPDLLKCALEFFNRAHTVHSDALKSMVSDMSSARSNVFRF